MCVCVCVWFVGVWGCMRTVGVGWGEHVSGRTRMPVEEVGVYPQFTPRQPWKIGSTA